MQIQRHPPQTIEIERSGDFVRLAKIYGSCGETGDWHLLARQQKASPEVVEYLRSAQPGAILSNDEWAGSIAAANVSIDFIKSIAPASIFYVLCGMGWPAPFNTRVVSTVTPVTAGKRTEGAAIRVGKMAFRHQALKPMFCDIIIVETSELVDSSEEASFDFLRAELTTATVATVDSAALAVITADIVPIAATDDVLADLRALLDVVNVRGAGSLLFAVAPNVANYMASDPLAFPNMSPRGGHILNVPALVSDAVAAGSVHLIDALGFFSNQGSIAIDQSHVTAIEMSDAPTQDITTPTAAQMVSLFQADCVAMRAIARFGLERIRSNAVATLDASGSGSWLS